MHILFLTFIIPRCLIPQKRVSMHLPANIGKFVTCTYLYVYLHARVGFAAMGRIFRLTVKLIVLTFCFWFKTKTRPALVVSVEAP